MLLLATNLKKTLGLSRMSLAAISTTAFLPTPQRLATSSNASSASSVR